MNRKGKGKSQGDFNECGCIAENIKGSKLDDFSQLGDGELLEVMRMEVDGDYWTEREEKVESFLNNYIPTSWDYPLTLFNRTHSCSVRSIGDKALLKNLELVDTSEKRSDLSSSSCICGGAESIDNCPECRKVFSCNHKNCSTRIDETDPQNSKLNYRVKFSCGSTLLQRVTIPAEVPSDGHNWLLELTQDEMKPDLKRTESPELVSSPDTAEIANNNFFPKVTASDNAEKVSESFSSLSLNSPKMVPCGRGRPHQSSIDRMSHAHAKSETSPNIPEDWTKTISLNELIGSPNTAETADNDSVLQIPTGGNAENVSETLSLHGLNGPKKVPCGRGRPHQLSLDKWPNTDSIFEKSLNIPEDRAKEISANELVCSPDTADNNSVPQIATSENEEKVPKYFSLPSLNCPKMAPCGRGRSHELSLDRWSLADTISERSLNITEEEAKGISFKELFDERDVIDIQSTTNPKREKGKKPNSESTHIITHGNPSVKKTEEGDDLKATRIAIKLKKLHKEEDDLKRDKINSSIQEKRAYINDLLTPKLDSLLPGPTTEDLIKCKDGLYVTHFYSFYDVHVVTAEAHKIHIPLLKEDILYQLRTDDERKPVEAPPYSGTVLLAPLDGNYARAVVEIENTSKNDLIGIRFFDEGTEATIPYKACFEISKDLLNVPILGSRVLLKDIPPMATSLILKSDFEEFAKKWPKSRTCVIKSLGQAEGVDLHFNIEGVSTSLSKEIINLGKWEWEKRIEKTVGIDEDVLCDESNWNPAIYPSYFRRLPDDRYTLVSVINSNPETAELIVLFNEVTEPYHYEREVLRRQFERYCKYFMSEKSIYPALEEKFWINISPNGDENLKELRGVDRWSRGIRQDDLLVNLDEFEWYPLKEFKRNVFKIRKYCPGFDKVPFFMTACVLKDCLPVNEKNKLILKALGSPNVRLFVKALNPEGDEVTCREYNALLKFANEA